MVLAVFCSAAEAVFELLLPLVMADIVDVGIPASNTAFILQNGVKMIVMAVIFFLSVTAFEKTGMVRYDQFRSKKESGGNIKVLLQHHIIKWTFIAMLTGIVRTAVLFWLPTYISDYLCRDTEQASIMYSIGTTIIAVNSFLAVFIFERLHHNLNCTILLFFSVSAADFLGVFLVKQPYINFCLLVIAMVFSNCASSIMWSRYCPSLRDTGMVSAATGFLDFMSYMAAAVSSRLFANAVADIGWHNLILIWLGLMVIGMLTAFPWKKKR